jgi:phosphonate transport system substrate-binding protein
MDHRSCRAELGGSPRSGELRLVALTYLAPGIPLEFFQLVTDHLARALGCQIQLETESRISGPMHGEPDPFAEGRADIGFLCAPSYLYLRSQGRPSIELVPAGFVFRDERAAGEAVYFSEVVVRPDHHAQGFGDLAGSTWGYNDECSLSGYFAALQELAELGRSETYFGRSVCTGSHDASIESILNGAIDGAAIDSTVLARAKRERPELERRLRVLDSWGPFPIQPVVVRSALGGAWLARIADALLDLHSVHRSGKRLSELGLERCVPIDDAAYAEERRALCALGQIPAQASGVCLS